MRTYAELTDDKSYLWEVECAQEDESNEDDEEQVIKDDEK